MKVPVSDCRFIDLTAPVVSCLEYASPESEAQLWRFECRYCHEWHYHGVGEGHREAHCTNPASPYCITGYNLILCGEDEDD
jgi:hypothetical protein